jgi:hypothetical protein
MVLTDEGLPVEKIAKDGERLPHEEQMFYPR